MLPEDERSRRPQAPPQRRQNGTEDLAERRLQGLVRVVATAEPGRRNELLFFATNRAFERIDDGELEERRTLDLLSEAALGTGLGGAEVRAVIASALRTTRGAL